MKNQVLALLIGAVIVGCSPDPATESRVVPGPDRRAEVPVTKMDSIADTATIPAGRGGAVTSGVTSEKAKQAIGNIRSYLVDLEGELRVGPAGTWQMKASSARHIAGNVRIDIDTLARAGLDVGRLQSSLSSVSGALSSASEENWNRIIGSGRNDINEMRGALSSLEKGW